MSETEETVSAEVVSTEQVQAEPPTTEKKERKKGKRSRKTQEKKSEPNSNENLLQLMLQHSQDMTELLTRQARDLAALKKKQDTELRRHARLEKKEQKKEQKEKRKKEKEEKKEKKMAKTAGHSRVKLSKLQRQLYADPSKPLRDPNSVADLAFHRVSSYHLDLTADFKRSVLSGFADLTFKFTRASKKLRLDVKDLEIKRVSLNDENLPFAIKKPQETGSTLQIDLSEAQAAGSTATIRIHYETTPQASAIQWLPPAQTVGKVQPYLFTQCQAIHARSVMPCQDSPAVKSTYTARIVVPTALTALMSAASVDSKEEADGMKAYTFEQKVPIPSYLLALAIGALEKRDISERCAVWSEAQVVDAARYEFEDTERFLAVAEEICGPYAWGRYDILLMPPSFPYGGMENPCLTFVTPTLLAGDKSLANVVAHEISHSWMGNLVGCETWEHFWMNEGFTVYLERKICKALHGNAAMHLDAISGYEALKGSVERYGCSHNFTKMNVNLKGVDPDDAFSSVPYEKGFNFLFYLESLFGEQAMNGLLRAHCEEYKFSTVNGFKWKKFFENHFAGHEALSQIDWTQWLHSPGLPPRPAFDTSLIDQATTLAASLAAGNMPTDVDLNTWSSNQMVGFLESLLNLQKEGSSEFATMLQNMETTFAMSQFKNSEIRFRWLTLNIKAGNSAVFADAVAFMTEQGRMKFVRPLYRDLFRAGDEGRTLALATFQEFRTTYHTIASTMIAKDLGVDTAN
jgi:leukotriene-A4 hydrolase